MQTSDHIPTAPEKHDVRSFKQNPWSRVFSGPCGRFIILCFFLSLVLFVAMVAYVGIYISSLLNDPDILCLPFFFLFWGLCISAVLILWFSTTFCSIWLDSGTEEADRNCRGCPCTYISMMYLVCFLCLLIYTLIFGDIGVIVKESDANDTLFQYLGSRFDPQVYRVFSLPDNTSDIYRNLTCDSALFYGFCPHYVPLVQKTNFSEAFKCLSYNEDDLESLLLHLESPMRFSRNSSTLGIAFTIFFAFGYVLAMKRRFSPREEWIENRLCWSSGEYTRLI